MLLKLNIFYVKKVIFHFFDLPIDIPIYTISRVQHIIIFLINKM